MAFCIEATNPVFLLLLKTIGNVYSFPPSLCIQLFPSLFMENDIPLFSGLADFALDLIMKSMKDGDRLMLKHLTDENGKLKLYYPIIQKILSDVLVKNGVIEVLKVKEADDKKKEEERKKSCK